MYTTAITRAVTREPQRLSELLANVHMPGQNAPHAPITHITKSLAVFCSLCRLVCQLVCLALFGWWAPNSKYDCHQMGDSD